MSCGALLCFYKQLITGPNQSCIDFLVINPIFAFRIFTCSHAHCSAFRIWLFRSVIAMTCDVDWKENRKWCWSFIILRFLGFYVLLWTSHSSCHAYALISLFLFIRPTCWSSKFSIVANYFCHIFLATVCNDLFVFPQFPETKSYHFIGGNWRRRAK